jgi:hypothetical protein
MKFRSRGQILVEVLEACEWFKKVGIPTTGTRLEAIRDYLDELLSPTTPSAWAFFFAIAEIILSGFTVVGA